MTAPTDWLGRVSVRAAGSAHGLQVFGLHLETAPHAYQTLDEALGAGSVEVTELSEGGSVPTLKFVNKSAGRVFLMAGEQLVGAKQNRVLNTSLLVEAATEVNIPVSCVEQGRWAYRSKSFGSHGTASHGKLRQVLSASVTESYMASSTPTSNQGAVWREVSRKMHSMDSVSDSMAMETMYESKRADLDALLAALPVPEGCNGVVFAVNGKVAGIDLFDRPETLGKLWPKLVRAYAVDAMEDGAGADLSEGEVESWLKNAAMSAAQPFKSPALGDDVRLTGAGVAGSGLVVEDRPVHVQLFAGGAA